MAQSNNNEGCTCPSADEMKRILSPHESIISNSIFGKYDMTVLTVTVVLNHIKNEISGRLSPQKIHGHLKPAQAVDQAKDPSAKATGYGAVARAQLLSRELLKAVEVWSWVLG